MNIVNREIGKTEFGLHIISDARILVEKIYQINFPTEERYGLQSQIRRSAVSVVLNLVEGSSYIDNNRQRFYQMSLGSLLETMECYLLLHRLQIIHIPDPIIIDIMDKIKRTLIKLRRRE